MKNDSTNLEAHTKRRIDTPTMSNSITVEIHGSPDIRRAPQLEIDRSQFEELEKQLAIYKRALEIQIGNQMQTQRCDGTEN